MLVFILLMSTVCVVLRAESTSKLETFSAYFSFDQLPPNLELPNAAAERTVYDILRHTRIILTDKISTPLIQQISTNIREVLTSETGSENLLNIVKTIGSVLRDENGSIFVQAMCSLISKVTADLETANKIIRSVINTLTVIFRHANIQPALEGLLEGLEIYFSQLTQKKVDAGVKKLRMLYRKS